MKHILLIMALSISTFTAQAQLFVDTSYSIQDMITGFFGGAGVTISNVTYTGATPSLAFFEGSQSNIGINAGLMISTGEAVTAIGPNDQENAGTIMGIPGSPWLNALIPGYYTYDAAIIEMDIVPSNDTLSFRYVFGSEEYKEYVNSQYNDLFAFFIQGPGFSSSGSVYIEADTAVVPLYCSICVDSTVVLTEQYCYYDSLDVFVCLNAGDTLTTLYCYQEACGLDTIYYPGYWIVSPGGSNLAFVPGTNLPVSINNLNQLVNSQYFIDNIGGSTVQYDAFTTPLLATALVTPGETYHIRIAIADAGDAIWDSGVFLGIESLGGDSLLPVNPVFLALPPTGNTVQFENKTFWATKWHWDFGDGSSSEERVPSHTFAADGIYNVQLTASNWCSQKTFSAPVQIGVSNTNELAENVFHIAPNPANGFFVLDLAQETAAQVRIYSTDGRLLLDQRINDGTRVNLDPYGKGIFMVQVIANGGLFTQKVVNR